MKRWIVILVIMLLTLLLAASPCIFGGCGDQSTQSNATGIEENDQEETDKDVEEAAGDEQGEEEDTSTSTPPVGFGYGTIQGGSGGIMLLKDVTFTQSGDYDRIVIELTTGHDQPPREGVCLYSAQEGALPYSDIEGNPITVAGDYYFEITLDARSADLTLPDAPNVYEGPEAFDVAMEIIKDATFVTAYADHTIILLLGLGERAPFRVEEMSNPSRIVVDFAPS
ncbi:MAG: hypothetical protein JW854_04345 [Actinobacteria bacterium]|nr:hypothetical protein [Actinomycetota bacterium]